MNSAVQLVVARYKEDVSWLADMPYPALVYDKSGAPRPSAQHALPNVGRETHTYLHHILAHYPDFAEYTVFLQARPFEHLAEKSGPKELAEQIAAAVGRGAQFKGFAYYTLKCDGLGRPHDMRAPESKGKWAGYGKDIPVAAVYEQLFAGAAPEKFHVKAPAGLFLVSRERILLRPRGLYETAMRQVLADPHDANNTGHAFERLWYLIFNGYAALNKPASPSAGPAKG